MVDEPKARWPQIHRSLSSYSDRMDWVYHPKCVRRSCRSRVPSNRRFTNGRKLRSPRRKPHLFLLRNRVPSENGYKIQKREKARTTTPTIAPPPKNRRNRDRENSRHHHLDQSLSQIYRRPVRVPIRNRQHSVVHIRRKRTNTKRHTKRLWWYHRVLSHRRRVKFGCYHRVSPRNRPSVSAQYGRPLPR